MAGSVNKVILIGNLGRDPEVRSFPSGGKVVNLRVATSENWRDKQSGERKEKTEWHSVAIYNDNLARIAEQYLRKGSKVYLEGQLETRKWQDRSGQDRYSTEVTLRFNAQLTLLIAAAKAAAPRRRTMTGTQRRRREPEPGRSAGRRDPVLGVPRTERRPLALAGHMCSCVRSRFVLKSQLASQRPDPIYGGSAGARHAGTEVHRDSRGPRA